MKKIVFLIVIYMAITSSSFSQELNKVTFGLGVGYNHLFGDTYKYGLSTDNDHALQMQKLSRSNFVISSIVVFKLGKLEVDDQTNELFVSKKNEKVKSNGRPTFWQRLSIKLSINLLDVNSDSIFFNKTTDGG